MNPNGISRDKSGRFKRRNKVVPIAVLVLIIVAFVVLGVRSKLNSSTTGQLALTTPGERNKARQTDLKRIGEALTAYHDAKGQYPGVITASATAICVSSGVTCKSAHLVDLGGLVSGGELLSMPQDPLGVHSAYSSGYTIARDASGELILAAPQTESHSPYTVKVSY